MASKTTKPTPNKGDLRPNPDAGGHHSKPIYNPGDYRPGWGGEHPMGGGHGKGKRGKIWHYSRRIAPGIKDPWGGIGR